MIKKAVRTYPDPSSTPLQAHGLLTVQELARALKLNPQTLYRLVRQGLVPAIRIGKSLRFDPAQVRATLRTEKPSRRSAGKRIPAAQSVTITRLDDLRGTEAWLSPSPDLCLERFAVCLPAGADLTALAYDRTDR
jgi:excisionase family DNA binding protein